MKTSYQQYVSYVKQTMKKTGCTMQQVESFCESLRVKANSGPSERLITDFYTIGHDIEYLKGRCTHFFIKGDDFIDWLIDCVPSTKDGAPEPMVEMLADKLGCIHFESGSKYRCFIFSMAKNMRRIHPNMKTVDSVCVGGFISWSYCGGESSLGSASMFFDGSIESNNTVIDHSLKSSILKYIRFVAGLGMYLSCFPEMLKDGPPDDVKHPSYHQYADIKTVGISPQVRIHSERGEVTPHFRRGHFRVLRSEQFTKKRFQVVFVRQCFVKGEAVTILSPEEDSHEQTL